jgi:uncharacterized protein YbjQ (UPF0145 family)
MKNGRLLFTFLGIVFTVVAGCATGSTIVTGKVLTAIDPNEVNIYLDPPAQYETIGIIEASSDVEFSRQKAQDRVINELKTRAAKVGANGVLLMTTGSTTSGAVIISGMIISETAITAQGRAIYVVRE